MSSSAEKLEFADHIDEHIAWCPPASGVAAAAGLMAVAAAQEAPIIRESTFAKRATQLVGAALIMASTVTTVHYLRMHRHANQLRDRAREQQLDSAADFANIIR